MPLSPVNDNTPRAQLVHRGRKTRPRIRVVLNPIAALIALPFVAIHAFPALTD